MTVLPSGWPRGMYSLWMLAPAELPPIAPPRASTSWNPLLGERAGVGVHEAPLPPAAEPDTAGLRQHLGESRIIRQFRIAQWSDTTFFAPYFLRIFSSTGHVGSGSSIAVGMTTMSASGPPRLDEPLPDLGAGPAAADDDERALLDHWLGRFAGGNGSRAARLAAPGGVEQCRAGAGLVLLAAGLPFPFARETISIAIVPMTRARGP